MGLGRYDGVVSSRSRSIAVSAVVLALVASAAPQVRAMDPKVEESAKKAASEAMDVDFLSLDMKKAKKKLSDALKKCGKEKCSKPMLGLLHRNLAIVALNAKDTKSGDSEFAQALANDPNVSVPKDYLDNPVVKKSWEAAKKNAGGGGSEDGGGGGGGGSEDGGGGGGGAAADGNLTVKIKAAPIGYELPIVIEVPKGVDPSKVKLSFKTAAMDKYKVVDAKKAKNKWLVIVGCDATGAAGTLKMFARAYDGDDVELEHWGTIKKPVVVKVTDAIADEDRPLLPGDEEPKSCSGEDGGAAAAETCSTDEDCKKGASCVEDDKTGEKTCHAKEEDEDKPSAATKDAKKLWFGIDGQLDMLFIGQQSELCKQQSWACTVNTPDGRQDVGVPDATGIAIRNDARTGGKTDGGSAFGTKHVWLSIDYFVASKLSIGTRLGYIIGGNPTDVAKFNPIHFEARAQYFFTESGFRPYVLLSSGYARTEGSVGGVIVTPNDPTKATNGNGTISDVSAWKLGGPIFIGTGFGMWVGIGDRVALNLALKVLVPLPVLVPAFAPEAGIKFGF